MMRRVALGFVASGVAIGLAIPVIVDAARVWTQDDRPIVESRGVKMRPRPHAPVYVLIQSEPFSVQTDTGLEPGAIGDAVVLDESGELRAMTPTMIRRRYLPDEPPQ